MPAPKGWTQLGQLFPTPPSDFFVGGKKERHRECRDPRCFIGDRRPRREDRWFLGGDSKRGTPWHPRAHQEERSPGVRVYPELLEEASPPSLPAPHSPAALGGPGLG